MPSCRVHSQGRLNSHARRVLAVIAAGMVCFALSAGAVDARYRTIADTQPDHTRAVEMARAGRHEPALQILRRLLAAFPDDYALQRDHVMITAQSWMAGTT